eukprot:TRINITY_DN2152_c0_g1_i5.p1 TRINITY_DN2152_c0_g1~~TRINITY_DN2152_c0_g1_i5.p1  ORF type:complete len:149 (+),score=41.23 TRINITY_DN2152_c0_g1_i5:90-536(+)
MRYLLRAARRFPALRNQTTSKNFTRVSLPIQENEDKVQRTGFKKGDEAPWASHATFEYPENFQPYTFNYSGYGLLIGATIGFAYAAVEYEKSYLNRVELTSRPTTVAYQPQTVGDASALSYIFVHERFLADWSLDCLLYTSPSPRDQA